MGMYIENKQYLISYDNNSEENDLSLMDNTIDIYDPPIIIHPSVHEMLLLTKNIIDYSELFWFIIMMSICFSGIGGIILMVFMIKN
jgi:hypothetical protein